jgi:hypothetical protein
MGSLTNNLNEHDKTDITTFTLPAVTYVQRSSVCNLAIMLAIRILYKPPPTVTARAKKKGHKYLSPDQKHKKTYNSGYSLTVTG